MNTQETLKPIAGDFEKWFDVQFGEYEFIETYWNKTFADTKNINFYSLPPDFQLGVLLRYFRERWGIEIEHSKRYYNDYEEPLEHYLFVVWKHRANNYREVTNIDFNTAFSEALTKAVELANKQETKENIETRVGFRSHKIDNL